MEQCATLIMEFITHHLRLQTSLDESFSQILPFRGVGKIRDVLKLFERIQAFPRG